MQNLLYIIVLSITISGCASSPVYYLSSIPEENSDSVILWSNGKPYFQQENSALQYTVKSRSARNSPYIQLSIKNLTDQIIEIDPTQIQCNTNDDNNQRLSSVNATDPNDLIRELDTQIQDEKSDPLILLDIFVMIATIASDVSGDSTTDSHKSHESNNDYWENREKARGEKERRAMILSQRKTQISKEHLGRHSLLPYELISGIVTCAPDQLAFASYYSLQIPEWADQPKIEFNFKLSQK